ncbi:kelch repeat and BTB (POZ) domain containing 12 [Seminavis robusta]|uniref:Kelch repeat and BTB (POZ) domain containing 12 n=1 Tax=Seminavis robusta TaxID=568900 RepID=A0A9N8E3Y7_9STRA|nr:kelch repeat and BTB (POZ) domain containing 12 [Seminavis robusta]|eukprot:Sro500_g155240.1 kelch repeat and BTB (POZ) domain containing 12 (729) ;mRNA; r:19464-21887
MSYDPADAARELTRRRQRAQRERRRNSPPRRRNFGPPSSRERERTITTTRQLLKSWSRRTNRLCLPTSIVVNRKPLPVHRSLTAEVANQHPGSWEDAYKEGLAKLFQEEMGCDITFRVAGTDTVVKAHSKIVGARKQEIRFGHKLTWFLLQDERGVATTSPEGKPPSQWQPGQEIIVDDYVFTENPEQLRTAIASCYGIFPKTEEEKNRFCLDENSSDIMEDVQDLNPMYWSEGYLPTPWEESDVSVIGSPGASAEEEHEWTIDCHAAILCANSEYFAAVLSGRGWATEEAGTKRILRLDSLHFAKDTIIELLNGLYSNALDMCEEETESILHLIDAAAYLGMKAASLRCEEALATRIDAEHLVEMIHFAQETGAKRLLLDCHKYLCRNLAAVQRAGTLAQLESPQLEAMLHSNFVEAPEDDILNALMTWADATNASFDETKDLLTLVRLAFVPVDSQVMLKAIAKNLVTEDMLQVCRLFQTDGDYRATMMKNDPLYVPRQTRTMTRDLEAKLRPPLEDRFRVMRMLGVVNGRNNFENISSVKLNKCDGHLVCGRPSENALEMDTSGFDFDRCITPHMARDDTKPQRRVGRSDLESLPLEDAKQLLALLLRHENELRLHPLVQAKLGAIGEDEDEMSSFTTALQVFVSEEFSVDPVAHSLLEMMPRMSSYVRWKASQQLYGLRLSAEDPSLSHWRTTFAGSPLFWLERVTPDPPSAKGPGFLPCWRRN